jgi:DNA-binding NarL/FixJ family response regulator
MSNSHAELGRPVRIMLVDDHELFRNGIASLLDSQPDMEVVAEASDGLEAQFRAVAINPDLILMDINMPGVDGLESLGNIRSELPDTIIIMLTVLDEDEKIFKALRAGANGYILKNSNSEDFIGMLRDAMGKGAAISSEITRRVIDEFAKTPEDSPELNSGESISILTKREQDVLRLIVQGFADKEIGQQLSISVHTVKSHVRNILSKLHVKNRHAAADLAIRSGFYRTK